MNSQIKMYIKKYSIYIILFLASILRLFNISKRDFWYDEAFTGVAIKESFSSMMNMIIQDVHPPLYYISVKLFASFFDYSVFGIRLYSAVFGILGVWAVYLFTKELFNKKAALWASLITAISPFAIQYSQEARMYSMLGFLIIIASYFFIKGLKTDETKNYILWGLFLGLASLTHYMGIIFAPIYIPVFVLWKLSQDNKFNLKFLINLKQIVLGYGVATIFFLPWIKNFYNHIVNSENGLSWIKPASFGDIFVNIRIFIFGTPLGEMTGGLTGMPAPNEFYGISGLSILSAIIILLTGVITYLLIKEDKRKVFSLLFFSLGFMLLLYILSFLGKHYLVSRYLLPSAYFIFILFGLWLSKIKPYYAVSVLVVYVAFFSLIIPVQHSLGWNQLRDSSDKYEDNDFYILNSFDYVIAKYYFSADHLILYNMDWPEYNSESWVVIGSSLKRTEKFSDIKNDEKGLIISNTILRGQIEDRKDIDDRKDLNFEGLRIVADYKNINVYQFKKR